MRVWSHPLRVVVLLWAFVLVIRDVGGIAAMPAASVGQIYLTARGAIVRMNDMTGAGLAVLGPTGTWMTRLTCPRPFECDGVSEFGAVGMFVDEARQIYVTDLVQNRIVRIGSGLTSLGTTGAGVGQFNQPTGIFLDERGRIYVTDSSNGRIVRMNDMTGAGWTTLGSRGRGVDQFDGPTGIFIDHVGRIYVADSGNRRIVRVNDMAGAGWTTLGTEGEGINQFRDLGEVSVDGRGRIYIADTGNGRIVRVNDMSGAGWAALGKCPPSCTKINVPMGVFVDDAGRIYVAEMISMYTGRIVRVNDMTGSGWTAFDLLGIPYAIFVR